MEAGSSFALRDRNAATQSPTQSPKQSPTQSSTPAEADTAARVEDDSDGHLTTRPEFSLPPVDRGKHAWFFLVACIFIEALTWGTWSS